MSTNDKPAGVNDIEHGLYEVEDELQDFEERQGNVTRTLQMIVYPAMVAFFILAAYGFYLVQSLTTDVHKLTETISEMNATVHTHMGKMSGNLETMTGQMGKLVQSTGEMSHNIVGMNSSTQDMAGNMQEMNASTQNMAVSTYNMQRDMWSMNKNISGPMKMFNKFNPFGSDNNSPYVVPPPAVATPYYNYYTWPQSGVNQPQPVMPTAAVMPTPPAVVETLPTLAPAAAPQSIPPNGAATAKDEHSSVEKVGNQFVAMMIRG